MEALKRIFYSIRTFEIEKMKLASTEEFISQIHAYEDHSVFILKNIYLLISSDVYSNRICGAMILYSLKAFKYEFNFTLTESASSTQTVYLQSKTIEDDPDDEAAVDEAIDNEIIEEVEIQPLKKAKKEEPIIDVQINCANDFFKLIYDMLLDADWNKRHGAFIAYSAVVASENPNFDLIGDLKMPQNFKVRSEVTSDKHRENVIVNGEVFNKIFEILKNDKFDDFEDEVTASPVREAACILLKYIYKMEKTSLILSRIFGLLTSSDWQDQFSAMLALLEVKCHFTQEIIDGHVGASKNKTFLQILLDILKDADEDVKFLCARVLSFIIENFAIDKHVALEMEKLCWYQIETSCDTDHSKSGLLSLLTVLHLKYSTPIPEDISSIFSFYTSPISIVRDSVFKFSSSFNHDDFIYLISESIIFDTTKKYKQVEVLNSLIDGYTKNPDKRSFLKSYFSHFMNIISKSVHNPYDENSFKCYDDTFFATDGIKSIGPMEILNSRTKLFSEMIKIEGIDQFSNETVLEKTFYHCYNAYYLNPKERDADHDASKSSLKENILKGIESDFKKYKSLKKMPIKEFYRMIEDFTFLSLFPLAYDNCLELIRKYACEFIYDLDDFNLYFQLENSLVFIDFFTNLAKKSPHIDRIALNLANLLIQSEKELSRIQSEKPQNQPKSQSKKRQPAKNKSKKNAMKNPALAKTVPEDGKSYLEIVHEQIIMNIQTFFGAISSSFASFTAFSTVLTHPDRQLFFKHTAGNYLDVPELKEIMLEALEMKNIPVLKLCLRNSDFNCLFVSKMRSEPDIGLIYNLIDYVAPSLNILLLEPVLNNINENLEPVGTCICRKPVSVCSCKNASQYVSSILSRIACSLHFKPSENIRNSNLFDLIIEKSQNEKLKNDPKLCKAIGSSPPCQ